MISPDGLFAKELAEKREILQAYWDKFSDPDIGQVQMGKLERYLIRDRAWMVPFLPDDPKFEELFRKIAARESSFEEFFDAVQTHPLKHLRGLVKDEELIVSAPVLVPVNPSTISASEIASTQEYMRERGISASIAMGSALTGAPVAVTSETSDATPPVYSMFSVAKIFTGMLALIMVREGILSEEALRAPPQLDDSIKALLAAELPELSEYLKTVTLHELMTHQTQVRDYVGQYLDAIQKALDTGRDPPAMRTPEDFLAFADDGLSPKKGYSNLAFVLVGLAIQHAYNAGKEPADRLDYNQILQKYIVDAVGMPSFSQSRPAGGKTNLADPVAPYTQGSPGGCYWVNVEDLAKFGQWICQEAPLDSPLEKLMQEYGREFYRDQVAGHSGAMPSASADFHVSLKTGVVITALSVQPRMADDLVQTVRDNIFSKPAELEAAVHTSFAPPGPFSANAGVGLTSSVPVPADTALEHA